jgi:hypothetical protein
MYLKKSLIDPVQIKIVLLCSLWRTSGPYLLSFEKLNVFKRKCIIYIVWVTNRLHSNHVEWETNLKSFFELKTCVLCTPFVAL